MTAPLPDRQIRDWGIKRLRTQRRALRGAGHLFRMARHDGNAHIRPVTADRSVLVWRPSNRFLQSTIVQCGRPHLAWQPPSSTSIEAAPQLADRMPFSRHVVLLPFETRIDARLPTITGTIRLDGGTVTTSVDAHGREWVNVHGPIVFVDTDDMPTVE